MFNYLFVKYTYFYFLFAIYLSILCHTVVNTTVLVTSYNDSLPKKDDKIEQEKRLDRKQENIEAENKSRGLNTSDNKAVSSGLINNVTVQNKLIPAEDKFNSSASLPTWVLNYKDGALMRTGYVALGFMSIVLVFFVVRAVRLRQKRSKSRKYGIITSTVSDMEMEPLDKDDDEEEDTTLFDAQHKYSLQ